MDNYLFKSRRYRKQNNIHRNRSSICIDFEHTLTQLNNSAHKKFWTKIGIGEFFNRIHRDYHIIRLNIRWTSNHNAFPNFDSFLHPLKTSESQEFLTFSGGIEMEINQRIFPSHFSGFFYIHL